VWWGVLHNGGMETEERKRWEKHWARFGWRRAARVRGLHTFIQVYNMQCVTVYKVHVVGLQPLRVVWAQVLVFCCIY